MFPINFATTALRSDDVRAVFGANAAGLNKGERSAIACAYLASPDKSDVLMLHGGHFLHYRPALEKEGFKCMSKAEVEKAVEDRMDEDGDVEVVGLIDGTYKSMDFTRAWFYGRHHDLTRVDRYDWSWPTGEPLFHRFVFRFTWSKEEYMFLDEHETFPPIYEAVADRIAYSRLVPKSAAVSDVGVSGANLDDLVMTHNLLKRRGDDITPIRTTCACGKKVTSKGWDHVTLEKLRGASPICAPDYFGPVLRDRALAEETLNFRHVKAIWQHDEAANVHSLQVGDVTYGPITVVGKKESERQLARLFLCATVDGYSQHVEKLSPVSQSSAVMSTPGTPPTHARSPQSVLSTLAGALFHMLW